MVSGLLLFSTNFNMYVEALSIPQKIPTPSFTVTYKDLSYDVPESTSKDPYTGVTITNPSYHVDNRTIQVKIDNREFVKNYGHLGQIFYEARMKGSYENEWNRHTAGGKADVASQFTTIIFDSASGDITFPPGSFINYFPIPFEGKVDISVRAHIRGGYSNPNFMPPESSHYEDALLGESDWSKTQTVTISGFGGQELNQPSNSQDPDASSNQSGSQSGKTIFGFTLTEFSLIVAVISLSIALILVVLLFVYRTKWVTTSGK
ncbi:MAG: hypothetical protein FWH37_07235 [Candidatus Bathyarchaeota archaeon]|nr:hypothetical protein [Candidatus Termiticorpusculum sp.]